MRTGGDGHMQGMAEPLLELRPLPPSGGGGQAGQWSRTCGPLVWGLPEAPAHPLRLG